MSRTKNQNITGILVDIFQQKVYPARVEIFNGKISSIIPLPDDDTHLPYIMPGFVDAHVHIESSMLIPSEFARLAVVHGTVATVSDPHEIANVCGLKGVEYMIENGLTVPFKFNFGAPSCVPATIFETAGAELNSADVDKLLQREDIRYLSEMMNFPGVLYKDEEVLKKIAAAHRQGKPVDGHAPGLRGEQAQQYIDAGISTDHECFTSEEALDKLNRGMKILIREGSAAKNFEALIELLNDYPDSMMFCSDDKHPDSLVSGHINQLCQRAIAKGIDKFKILRAACVNPVLHYKLPVGLLGVGDPADFIMVKDLQSFNVLSTYINGELVAENGKSLISQQSVTSQESGVGSRESKTVNNFSCDKKVPEDFVYSISKEGKSKGKTILEEQSLTHDSLLTTHGSTLTTHHSLLTIQVIEALDGQLITNKIEAEIETGEAVLTTNTKDDLLKIVVVNRYKNAPVAKAFIKNFGLKSGAIASSVAHDSHNIVAIGVDDESICEAVNLVIAEKGGISCVCAQTKMVLALPVAGLMSNEDGYKVAEAYTAIDAMAKSLGSTLSAPFMTLSFMALLVIPHLKLSDKGLFDGDSFKFLTSA
jgi:adenine deaminase